MRWEHGGSRFDQGRQETVTREECLRERGILPARRRHTQSSAMKPGWQIAFPREAIQEGLCKLHQPVDIGEVGDQAQRDAYGATCTGYLGHPFGKEALRERFPFPLQLANEGRKR